MRSCSLKTQNPTKGLFSSKAGAVSNPVPLLIPYWLLYLVPNFLDSWFRSLSFLAPRRKIEMKTG